jgi:hypothetical protein
VFSDGQTSCHVRSTVLALGFNSDGEECSATDISYSLSAESETPELTHLSRESDLLSNVQSLHVH